MCMTFFLVAYHSLNILIIHPSTPHLAQCTCLKLLTFRKHLKKFCASSLKTHLWVKLMDEMCLRVKLKFIARQTFPFAMRMIKIPHHLIISKRSDFLNKTMHNVCKRLKSIEIWYQPENCLNLSFHSFWNDNFSSHQPHDICAIFSTRDSLVDFTKLVWRCLGRERRFQGVNWKGIKCGIFEIYPQCIAPVTTWPAHSHKLFVTFFVGPSQWSLREGSLPPATLISHSIWCYNFFL